MDESLGFTLIDSPDPLDLQARFSRLSHLYLYSIHSPAARSPTCAPIPVVSPAISFLMTAISPSCLKSNGNAFGPMAIPILNGQRSFAPGVHEQIAEQIMDANLPLATQPPSNVTR
jgi:hypothetical protein